jgi:hypothetical protein
MNRYASLTAATLAALSLISACTKHDAAQNAAKSDDESELTGGDKVRPGAVTPEDQTTTPPADTEAPPAQGATEAPPAS